MTGPHRIRIARSLTAERAMDLLRQHGWIRVDVDSWAATWNPASTKRDLFGPMTIDYVLHDDGGVHATVIEIGPTSPSGVRLT